MTPSLSVVVVGRDTHRLPQCLEHVAALRAAPDEVVVINSSAHDLPAAARAPLTGSGARLVSAPTSTAAAVLRLGLEHTAGDVVVFIDDATMLDPDWTIQILALYEDPRVVGAGGRIITGAEGEASTGLPEIGRLLPDGRLTHGFGADPGRVIEVDHIPAAAMSVRRSAVGSIGGTDDEARGVADDAPLLPLLLSSRGGTLLFQPRATARRAPSEPAGSGWRPRFDARSGHAALLVAVFGRRRIAARYAITVLRDQRNYLRSFAWRLGPRYADGSRRPWTARLQAPLVLLESLAELCGLMAGLVAARPVPTSGTMP
jgi:GT2 family glycosyltransferase